MHRISFGLIILSKFNYLQQWCIKDTRRFYQDQAKCFIPEWSEVWEENINVEDESDFEKYIETLRREEVWKLRYNNFKEIKKRPSTAQIHWLLLHSKTKTGFFHAFDKKDQKYWVCNHCYPKGIIPSRNGVPFCNRNEAKSKGFLEVEKHMFFECNLINNFWRRIDRKFKEIINSNTPFSLNMKQIVLLGTEGRELEEGEEEMLTAILLLVMVQLVVVFFLLYWLQGISRIFDKNHPKKKRYSNFDDLPPDIKARIKKPEKERENILEKPCR